MRNAAFLAAGLALLLVQANLFLLDRVVPNVPGLIPSLVLPLILFMGVHEYFAHAGRGVAFIAWIRDGSDRDRADWPLHVHLCRALSRGTRPRREARGANDDDAGGARRGVHSRAEHHDPRCLACDLWQGMRTCRGRSTPWRSRTSSRRAPSPLSSSRIAERLHAATASGSRADAGGSRGVSDLLVPRSDVGEFRKALQVDGARGVRRLRRNCRASLPASSPFRSRARGPSTREHRAERLDRHDPRRHPRRTRQSARVEPTRAQSLRDPRTRDAERATHPLRQRNRRRDGR